MVVEDRLCFVQFIHPGGEHQPDTSLLKNWNRGTTEGSTSPTVDLTWIPWRDLRRGLSLGSRESGEPESQTTPVKNPVEDGPHYICTPFHKSPSSYLDLHTT